MPLTAAVAAVVAAAVLAGAGGLALGRSTAPGAGAAAEADGAADRADGATTSDTADGGEDGTATGVTGTAGDGTAGGPSSTLADRPVPAGTGGPVDVAALLRGDDVAVPDAVPVDGPSLVAGAGQGDLDPALVPAGAVRLRPGADVAAAVAAAPPGTTFVFEPGVHRGVSITRPKARMRFLGERGAVWSGAEEVRAWKGSGPWTATVAPPASVDPSTWQCEEDAGTGCGYPEHLFVDDRPLRRVDTAAEVEAGAPTFSFADDGTLTLGVDPAGARVELSRTPVAIRADSGIDNRGVEVRNLVIEKYATPAQMAAVAAEDSNGGYGSVAEPGAGVAGGWVIAGNTVRWNKAAGVFAGTGSLVVANVMSDNGQLGVKAAGRRITIAGNELARNNWARFETLWEAGGGKFWNVAEVRFIGNWSHANTGSGIWADYVYDGITVAGNVLEANGDSGVVLEMTLDGTVTHNLVARNDLDDADNPGYWSGGVFLYNVARARVSGNVLAGNIGGVMVQVQERGCITPFSQMQGTCEPGAPSALPEDVVVSDNEVSMTRGVTGLIVIAAQDYPPYTEQPATFAERIFTGGAVRFERNTYVAVPGDTGWDDGEGADGQFMDTSKRFVWGFPHGWNADPGNVYAWTDRRFLGFDDWQERSGATGETLVRRG